MAVNCWGYCTGAGPAPFGWSREGKPERRAKPSFIFGHLRRGIARASHPAAEPERKLSTKSEEDSIEAKSGRLTSYG